MGAELRDPGQDLLRLHRAQRGDGEGTRASGRLSRESYFGSEADDRSHLGGSLKLQTEAAVDCENLPRNKLRSSREEQNGLGNLLSSAVAPPGRVFGHPPHKWRGGLRDQSDH